MSSIPDLFCMTNSHCIILKLDVNKNLDMEISAHVMEDYLISAFSIPMMYYIKDF